MPFSDLLKSNSINELYPKPDEFKSKHVSYGTAGFRTKASDLDWVMYRMGMLACLRSICLKCQHIGCMITASHNPAEDNGCKLVDPLGDMLEEKWETYASQLVNSNDLRATLVELCESSEFKPHIEWFDAQNGRVQASVVVAHDTRPSCAPLLEAFKSGLTLLNGSLTNYGVMSTPQLHYMVRCLNTNGSYGEPSEQGYFRKLTRAFFNVWSTLDLNAEKSKYELDLYVDGANGVGAEKIKTLAEILAKHEIEMVDENRNEHGKQPNLKVHLFNDSITKPDLLNHSCGADYVKVQQKPPQNLPPNDHENCMRKYCSFDGDADRIVYYFLTSPDKQFVLLDGDKISTLIATQLKVLLANAQLDERVSLCIVQTAYANGSSTNFIENVMKVKVSCVPTGVKHLHHEAQKYDIGVYFEANGHGTIIFSEKAEQTIESEYEKQIGDVSGVALRELLSSNERVRSLYQLKHLKDCINQTVGDALSDLLVVELCLAARGSSALEWSRMYTDLPSRQLKVRVADRNRICTTDAERRVSEPIELQTRIDEAVQKEANERAFVRPSGTEDVVRVYAEGDTQEKADSLANRVSQLVFDLAGGVGPRP